MLTLLSILESKGCSVAATLSDTMMGNEQFYVKMLKKLGNNKSIDKLEEAFAAKDVAACFAASHDLKGMYGTLGLTPLLELCKQIVEPARAGSMEGFEKSIPTLRNLHNHFLEIITSN